MHSATRPQTSRSGLWATIFFIAALIAAIMLPFVGSQSAHAATLDHVRQAGKLTLGYREDAPPFSFKDESGRPAGFIVALCEQIADQVKTTLGLPTLNVEWVSVTIQDGINAVQQGKIDLLCGEPETLAKRKDVSFSIPIYPSGIGAVLRADSPYELQVLLAKGQAPPRPIWRGSPARTLLQKQTFSVVAGSRAQSWLAERLSTFQIDASVVPVENHSEGVKRVLDRSANVFFGDRAILLETAKRSSGQNLIVLDRLFTHEPLALALQRNDDDFRLLVDSALSQFFRSNQFSELFAKWFGELDKDTAQFFRFTALPE